jgi:hypothetical protein
MPKSEIKNKVRTCFVIDQITSRAGVELQLLLLLKHLDRTRIEPFLVFALPMGETARKVVPADVPVLYLELKKLFSCSALAKARQFRRFLKENKIDIIHVYPPTALVSLPLLANGAASKPLSASVSISDIG